MKTEEDGGNKKTKTSYYLTTKQLMRQDTYDKKLLYLIHRIRKKIGWRERFFLSWNRICYSDSLMSQLSLTVLNEIKLEIGEKKILLESE